VQGTSGLGGGGVKARNMYFFELSQSKNIHGSFFLYAVKKKRSMDLPVQLK